MDYFPHGHADVEKSHSRHGATDPPGSHKALQFVKACFARRQNQEVIIAPVAQAKQALRYPGQTREHDSDLEAENDVENY